MKKIETPAYTLIIYNNAYLEFSVKKDVVLTDVDAWQSKAEAENYLPGVKFYSLVSGEEFFQVTKEARETVASDKYATHMAAVALCSNELSMKILGNLYIKINRPKVPTKFFTDKQKAQEWLMLQMKK